MIKSNETLKVDGTIHRKLTSLLVLYDNGHEEVVKLVADVLGHTCCIAGSLRIAEKWSHEIVIGVQNDSVVEPEALRELERTVITAHCIDLNDTRDEHLTSFCDYEYLYVSEMPIRADLVRFLGFILMQTKPHENLRTKQRTTLLSTTFPDIQGVLPNLDILSVGADGVELRVDLLRDPATDGDLSPVPGLKYVGEQVMLLRQRTELPIIFTTRCTREHGRFPMDDPSLFYHYLRKAIQWGCEYIDVELWLPEPIRRKLAAEKGNSRIVSAWHDFSGQFKWTSPDAHRLFQESAMHGDIVKMIALVNSVDDNYDLESFRSKLQSIPSNPPFSGLNIGSVGQLSRICNKSLTPITHPLLPTIAPLGQLSAAEMNSMLNSTGQMPRLDIYAIGHVRSNGLAAFLEKCLNELTLPHQLTMFDTLPARSLKSLLNRKEFGGAYMSPALPVESAPYLPTLTEAASAIGQVDIITVRSAGSGRLLAADNIKWKGIRATLTREFVPSAYAGRTALILGNRESEAAAAIYALSDLDINAVYTIGFGVETSFGVDIRHLHGLNDLKRVEDPFVIISVLPAEKSHIASLIIKHFSDSQCRASEQSGKVFVDLSDGIKSKGDSVSFASSLGWASNGVADVTAWTIVETLRLLIGHNVPWQLAKLAGGRTSGI